MIDNLSFATLEVDPAPDAAFGRRVSTCEGARVARGRLQRWPAR
jgi:hypothetical protein